MWILWTITVMSIVLPVSGFVFCTTVLPIVYAGEWHRMQLSMPLRDPPWNDRSSWHLLQDSVTITCRVRFTAEPSGTK